MFRSFLFHTASFPVGRESTPFFSWKCISKIFAANRSRQKLQKLGGGWGIFVPLHLQMSLFFSGRSTTLLKNMTPFSQRSPLRFLALQIPSIFLCLLLVFLSLPPSHPTETYAPSRITLFVYLVHDCINLRKVPGT